MNLCKPPNPPLPMGNITQPNLTRLKIMVYKLASTIKKTGHAILMVVRLEMLHDKFVYIYLNCLVIV